MMDKKNCVGCRDNFYNNRPEGDCWLLETAELIKRKRVRMDEVPPWQAEPEELPNCYNASGFIFVSPERER